MLLDQGESIKAVAEWLGHSDPSFTLKTYTHLMPRSTERTKGVIGSLYSRRDASQDPDGPYTAQEDQVT
jgi:site-specific recombinase XerD